MFHRLQNLIPLYCWVESTLYNEQAFVTTNRLRSCTIMRSRDEDCVTGRLEFGERQQSNKSEQFSAHKCFKDSVSRLQVMIGRKRLTRSGKSTEEGRFTDRHNVNGNSAA